MNGAVPGEASRVVKENLLLVATALRSMEQSGSDDMQHPAFPILQAAWPLLTQIMQSPASLADQPIVAGMCKVTLVLEPWRALLAGLLPPFPSRLPLEVSGAPPLPPQVSSLESKLLISKFKE